MKFGKFLVTGGAGFIGSHIVDYLLSKNFDVKVVDSLSTGKIENISQHIGKSNFEFVRSDIRDVLDLEDVDVVFHEAAQTSVPFSIKNPSVTNDVNVSSTVKLLENALKSGVKKFVLASSCAVYGNSRLEKEDEKTRLNGLSPYALSKIAAESYAQLFHRLYHLDTVCLRYFNVYGPRQRYDNEGGVISIFLDRVSKGMFLAVYGDGTQTRDFVYVDDVVRANILAIDKNVAGEVFNIGTGKCLSIIHLVELLREMTCQDVSLEYSSRRLGDVEHSCADITKAREILGYDPKYAIEDGIKKMLAIGTSDKTVC